MVRSSLLFALTAGLAVGIGTADGRAQGTKQPPGKAQAGTEKVESKKEKATAMPDFARAYGLSFEGTETLGFRLTEARRKADPICLALIGTEMAAYEKVAKPAPVTAEAVKKEAAELAKQRASSKEITAVMAVLKDDPAAKDLTAELEQVKKAEADRAAAIKSGEAQRGIHRLTVTNTSEVGVHVHANGTAVGYVPPFSTSTFHTHHLAHVHVVRLTAHGPGHRWGPRDVHGHFESWHWTLNDNE